MLQQRFTYLPVRLGGDTGPQVELTAEMTDYCTRAGISVMAYSVGLGGAYSRYPKEEMPEEYRNPSNALRLKVLCEVADELGVDPQQVGLAWVWSNPTLMPLVAGSTNARIDENIAAMGIVLGADHLARLNAAGQ